MKKYLLLTVLAIIGYGFNNNAAAQCSPDAQYTQIGVWPKVLPESCINTAYDETITLIYPNDTCINIGGPQCQTFSLLDATITNVANLPLGLTHSCPGNGCVYLPGGGKTTASCFQISGTPTQAGTFTVTVTLALRTAVAGSFNVDYDFDVTINDVGVGNCVATGINGVDASDALTLSPNPTTGTVHLSKKSSGVMKNAEGETVLTLKNTDFIDMSSLSSGLYLLITEKETLKIVKE